MYVYIMCIGQRLRVRSRSWSHSGEPGTVSVATKKGEWTETSEASQEEEEEEGEGGEDRGQRRSKGGGGAMSSSGYEDGSGYSIC